MNIKRIIFGISLFLVVAVLVSCGGEKKRPVYADTDEATEEEPDDEQDDDEIVVPFRSANGVKYVQVKVNGVGLEMILDTGCSDGALISVAEANYLYQKGKLTQEDILGPAPAQIADGSVVENMMVNLREVVIDDRILCPNVTATVSDNIDAPLLLGNEILDRVATIRIDNDNGTFNFKLKR